MEHLKDTNNFVQIIFYNLMIPKSVYLSIYSFVVREQILRVFFILKYNMHIQSIPKEMVQTDPGDSVAHFQSK